MRPEDEDKIPPSGEEGGDSGETGVGGIGGGGGATEIEFRYKDVLSDAPRDDVLPPLEMIKHALAIHKDLHKYLVDKQKQTRKDRAAIKEGKLTSVAQYQVGRGYGANSGYKKHWVHDKFRGRDRQISAVPTQYDANTNEGLRDKLENRLQLKHAPKFNPKPRFP
jgi:hypothetical protein